MADDLTEILDKIESSLFVPAQRIVSFEEFKRRDGKILSEFLTQERKEKSHYQNYCDWEMLIGKPEEYSNPRGYIKKQRKRFKKQERVNRFIKISKGGPDPSPIFGDLPDLGHRMLDFQIGFYESVVAYAKQIGDEKNIKPIKVVRSPEERDEVYRKMFITRNQFEWYNNTYIQTRFAVLRKIHDVVDSFRLQYEELQNSFFDRMIKKIREDNYIEKLPPEEMEEFFLREEKNYWSKRAESIYGKI